MGQLHADACTRDVVATPLYIYIYVCVRVYKCIYNLSVGVYMYMCVCACVYVCVCMCLCTRALPHPECLRMAGTTSYDSRLQQTLYNTPPPSRLTEIFSNARKQSAQACRHASNFF